MSQPPTPPPRSHAHRPEAARTHGGVPPPGQTTPGRFKRQPPRRRDTVALAIVLTFGLIAAWAVYLVAAPEPVDVPRPEVAAAIAPPPPSDQVRVLAPSNTLAPDILAGFETDTGLKVMLETYDTSAQLAALADGGALSHDLVMATGVDVARLADANLLRPLPTAQLANFRTLDPLLLARAAGYDAGNLHSLVLLWGTLGLGFDAAKVSAQLEPGAPRDTWGLLFDPAQAAKFSSCGIQVADAPGRAFQAALAYLGLPQDSAKAEDIEAASRAWEAVRPHVGRFTPGDPVDALADGSACLAMATSGAVFQARAKARSAGNAVDISYVLPREGAVIWVDLLAIPAAAANPDHALKLIDYLLRPEVAARITNASGFANAVLGSALYVRPEIKSDAALIPGVEVLSRLAPEAKTPADIAGLRTRFWRLINAPP